MPVHALVIQYNPVCGTAGQTNASGTLVLAGCWLSGCCTEHPRHHQRCCWPFWRLQLCCFQLCLLVAALSSDSSASVPPLVAAASKKSFSSCFRLSAGWSLSSCLKPPISVPAHVPNANLISGPDLLVLRLVTCITCLHGQCSMPSCQLRLPPGWLSFTT